jgi:hypothetical protein
MNVKFLEHCKPGELVRARFGPNVEWGIVGYEGANSQQQRRVVVISGDNSLGALTRKTPFPHA